MLSHFALTSAADPLGRCGTLSDLPQQSLIELLVQDFWDVGIGRDPDGAFLDIHEWLGITLNASGDVDEIDFVRTDGGFAEGGSIDFQYVPQTVTTLIIRLFQLSGTMETSQLPIGLINLHVDNNFLTGTFDIKTLPEKIQSIDISVNDMSGSLAMDCLPAHVESFSAWSNEFSGTVNLSKLPASLSSLDIAENKLEGSIELRNVPPALQNISLNTNNFADGQAIVDAKHELQWVRLDRKFIGKVFDANGVKTTQYLQFPSLGCCDDDGQETSDDE